MPAAAAEIEHPAAGMLGDERDQRLQVLAAGVNGALQIGIRPRSELLADHALMTVFPRHGRSPFDAAMDRP